MYMPGHGMLRPKALGGALLQPRLSAVPGSCSIMLQRSLGNLAGSTLKDHDLDLVLQQGSSDVPNPLPERLSMPALSQRAPVMTS